MSTWDNPRTPKYRVAERNAVCRVCDKTLERDKDYMVSWYTSRNKGQYIHICPGCITDLYNLVLKYEGETCGYEKESRI